MTTKDLEPEGPAEHETPENRIAAAMALLGSPPQAAPATDQSPAAESTGQGGTHGAGEHQHEMVLGPNGMPRGRTLEELEESRRPQQFTVCEPVRTRCGSRPPRR